LEQTSLAADNQTSIQNQMPYADAAVTKLVQSLLRGGSEASSHFTASNLSAPTKYILAEANR